jgi:uncharacterized protein (DUF433 family)
MLRPVFDESVGVDWDGCDLVERVPGKVGGVPILKHSRLPADTVVGNFDAGVPAEEIADMFEMPIGTIQAVLDYARQYRGQWLPGLLDWQAPDHLITAVIRLQNAPTTRQEGNNSG